MKYLRVSLLAAAMVAGVVLPVRSLGLGLALEVAPAKLELAIPPGTTYNMPITVHNSSTDSTHVQATMVDFTVTRGGDYDFQRVGARNNSLLKWASINPREFDINANTTQQERLSFEIPHDSQLSGEYAGIVFFQTRPMRHAGGVAFSERIATKIYMTVPGTVKIDGVVAKMSSLEGSGGQLYRVLFKNTGNAHVYLNGTLTVQHDGQAVQQIAMPGEMLVERGGERLVELTGNRLSPGRYNALAVIDYGGKSMTGGQVSFDVH